MTSNSYTLLDLMIMLPNLHPRHLADLNVTSISTLRLVSKDIGNLALTAVQRCSVHLGVKEARPRCPQPKQVARLITDAQLQQLYVTLSIVSGNWVGVWLVESGGGGLTVSTSGRSGSCYCNTVCGSKQKFKPRHRCCQSCVYDCFQDHLQDKL